ncbi:MAG: DUF2298 domain-containing protein [Sphaerobacter sp.]|nr:DUF2298 domain-containing protein [Sphaerobacter sp.]
MTILARAGWYIVVGAILALSLGLRFYGHNWDGGWYLHPDERFIAIVASERIRAPEAGQLSTIFDPAHSPLNPRADDADGRPQSFAYGSLPLYVALATAWLGTLVTGTDLHSYAHIGGVGRALSALLDTGTVLLAIIFARRAYGRASAALTGILLATSVILLQLAHFFTTDTWITFFATATLVASLRLWESRQLRWAVIAGAALGAGLATKVSVVALVVPVALAAVAPDLPNYGWRLRRCTVQRLAAAGAAAVLVFCLFEPYALWRPGPFIEDAATQWQIVTGRFDVPFTRQFVGTPRGIYQLDNLVRWGLGPALGITALIGVVAALRRAIRSRGAGDILLVTWVLAYFVLIATAEAKFLRYMAPIVPAAVILAAAWLIGVAQRQQGARWRRAAAWALVAVVALSTATWAFAFSTIYTQQHPRLAASEWIFRNVPPGAALTAEYWDDALPIPLSGYPPSQYRTVTLDLYADRDNESALTYLASQLAQADYVLLSSDRLAGSIPRLPWRYPVYTQYYHLLETGQLGFQLVYTAAAYPRLGSLVIRDDAADESFRVYDHPEVRIYQKVEQLSTDELRERFAWALAQPWSPTRQPPRDYLLAGVPPDQLATASDLGWSARVTQHGGAAILVWLAALAVLAVVALPLSLTLLRAFPDLGWGFSRTIGLVGTGYLLWIAASLDVGRFTLPWIVASLALLALASWGGLAGHLPSLLRDLRARSRLLIASELVFLLGFGVFLFLRALNPDLWQTNWGGEKPMEMAYISAIARSATFPPYDPWFAGGIMNYYYYGFFLVALLWKLTGVPPEIGFQLAGATIAGLLSAGAFSLTAALASHALRLRRAHAIVGAGVIGVLLLIVVGNLDAAGQILTRRNVAVDFWQSSRVVAYAITEFPYFSLLWGDVHPHLLALPITLLLLALLYAWLAGRPADAPGRWPWLWSAATALVAGTVAVTNSWDLPLIIVFTGAALITAALQRPPLRPRAVALALLHWGLLVAAGRVLFAPFFSHFVVLVSGVARTPNGTALPEYMLHFGVFLGILAAAGVVLAVAHRGTPPARAPAAASVVAALASYTLVALAGGPARGLSIGGLILSLGCGAALGTLGPLAMGPGRRVRRIAEIGAIPASALAGGLAPLRPTAACLIPILAVAAALWFRLRDRPAPAMTLLSLAAAVGVTLGADLVYVVDDLSGSPWARMNTVFKFYFESWLLYAVAASVALAWLVRSALATAPPVPVGLIARPIPRRRGGARAAATRLVTHRAATGGLVVAAALILAGLAYPLFATGPRLAQRMPGSPTSPTLDGLAWMRGSWITNAAGQPIDFSGDYDAVRWLRQHAEGLPVILEASIGPYRGNGSRIAAATGLPAVLGWDRHERQQRPWPAIDQRLIDVRRIYTSPDVDEKRALLRRYGVRYIVVGDVERHWTIQAPFAGATGPAEPYATPEGLAAFDRMLGSDLRLVFESGATRIYELLPFPRLAPQAAGVRQP